MFDTIVWDDGTGPALFISGRQFGRAFVAKWTGTEWLAIGESTLHGDLVWSLASLETGGESLLYAGGRFQDASGTGSRLVIVYDGSEWRELVDPSSRGIEGFEVRTLAAVDFDGPKLVVGGDFTAINENRTTHFALWDGSSWESPSSGVPHRGGILGNVLAIDEWDDGSGPTTYVGGCFLYASGERANHIAKWESGRWVPLAGPAGVGVSDTVYALTVWDDGSGSALYAGGSFETAGGIEVNGIAKWDGKTWSALEGPMGVGLGGRARALVGWDDGGGSDLYVGGYFFTAGGLDSGSIARWDGEDWAVLESDAFYGGTITSLQPWDDGTEEALYLGGYYVHNFVDHQVQVRNIARWDGASWSDPDPENSFSHGHVYGLDVSTFEGPEYLYSAGDDGVKRFDGQSWSYVGVEDDPAVELSYALTSWSDGTSEDLYVGRYSYAQNPTWFLERWDGSEWSEFTGPGGFGPNYRVLALHASTREKSLWVGGDSMRVGDIPSSGIARYTCESPCSDAPYQRLCLDSADRFLIEIDWRDFDGNEGRGRVVPFQTGDSGLFYFFDADNWEMLVKVLDACGFNDHFWVFSAATTNVEYTLRVTNTETGETVSYFNPLGNAADAVTDTDAFATCP